MTLKARKTRDSRLETRGFFAGPAGVLVVALLALGACKKAATSAGPIPPGMPEGTPVTLNEREKDPPALESMKPWYGWQMKGLQLLKAGQDQEALYCFRQALLTWPPTMPDDVKADPRRALLGHTPIPTDTALQLGVVMVKLGDKKWALYWLDQFDQYANNKELTGKLREQAMALK
jgi:hypothetical protein